jgi:hypothetical protein
MPGLGAVLYSVGRPTNAESSASYTPCAGIAGIEPSIPIELSQKFRRSESSRRSPFKRGAPLACGWAPAVDPERTPASSARGGEQTFTASPNSDMVGGWPQYPQRDLTGVSTSIREIVAEAESLGASVETVAQWTEALVVHMAAPMTEARRSRLQVCGETLRHFRTDGDPHNPAHEGYIDDNSRVAISFPRSVSPVR